MENMNQIQMFTNEIFGNVRATVIDDNVWMVGKDVATALGYTNPNKALKDHCREEGVTFCYTPTNGGKQELKYINQRNVIRLIMRSKLKQAELFQDWVEDEIIPSVLATGEYKYNKKEEKQKFNPLQECALIVFGEDSSDVEKVNALNNLHKISIMQGERMICDDSMITIPQIREMVYKHYGDELDEKGAIISETFIEFNRYMKYAGYLHTIQFPRKDGRGLEKMYTYQPTKLFDEVLVAQGMATVRTLSDDRGKVEITYTKNIENLLVTESFKESFFKYIQLTTPMCA